MLHAPSIAPTLELTKRPRRNRKNSALRALTQENYLLPHQLIAPIFVTEAKNLEPISSMPEVHRIPLEMLPKEVCALYNLGIRAVDLFPYVPHAKKDQTGTEATCRDSIIYRAIEIIKKACPDLCVFVDIALDPYTEHGHDGLIDKRGYVLNDPTLKILAEMSVMAAQAGADVVAPSDMMDGRVGYIRKALDLAGYTDVSILSYAAKYASALYGPFREALNSAPKVGDKKSYQLNPANKREALLEVALDEAEGADMLLIKPASLYLDIISETRRSSNLPIAAYQVSGEYSMIMAAAQNGWLNGDQVFLESLLSMKRAGADFILTYAARRVAQLLTKH